MKPKVYIDGQEGTTGLQIHDRLAAREDITLLRIDAQERKDPAARKALMDEADIVFLCLPDAAAVEAVALVENAGTRIIDASTAHRTAPGWDYGFPELSPGHRAAIARSRRVANPGCHATGFICAVYPLVAMGLMPRTYPLTCFSITGYSGGGRKMIAQYEAPEKAEALLAPRLYGLDLRHKHLPEMCRICGLERQPVFSPVVDDYYKGMATTISLHNDLLEGRPGAREIWEALGRYYEGAQVVGLAPFGQEEPMLSANAMAGRDGLELIVCGSDTHTTVTARFDNLGKGASGAAVQNMNIMLGLEETTGLLL